MTDPNPKDLVAESYNEIAPAYNGWAVSRPTPRDTYLAKLLSRIPNTSRVLELGCGGGLPVTKLLFEYVSNGSTPSDHQSSRGAIIANDISSQQILSAKENVPEAEFICGDMTTLEFPESDLDAVVAFFSIFHLPRDEQPRMFELIHGWLKPGGYCVGSLGTIDQRQIKGNFFGKEMFWSSFGVDANRKMVSNAGFKIIDEEILDATDPEDTEDPDHGIKFWWFLAQK